jgi:hypothetical protein
MKATRTVVLLALLAAACTTKGENSALVITKVLISKGTTAAGVTTCPPITVSDVESNYILIGPDNFGQVFLVVDNRILDVSTQNTVLRTPSADFLPHQVVVSYEVLGTGTLTAPSTVAVAAVVVPTKGQGPVGIPALFPSTFGAVAGGIAAGTFIRATLHLEGKLIDGSTVKTAEREYIFRTCGAAGCAANPCL